MTVDRRRSGPHERRRRGRLPIDAGSDLRRRHAVLRGQRRASGFHLGLGDRSLVQLLPGDHEQPQRLPTITASTRQRRALQRGQPGLLATFGLGPGGELAPLGRLLRLQIRHHPLQEPAHPAAEALDPPPQQGMELGAPFPEPAEEPIVDLSDPLRALALQSVEDEPTDPFCRLDGDPQVPAAEAEEFGRPFVAILALAKRRPA